MPILLAVTVPLLWGSTYAVVALFLDGLSPLWVAVWRALPAGALLLLLHPKRPPLPWSRVGLLGLFNIALFFPLLFTAAYRLPGSVAGTLGATMPLQLLLLQWLWQGKRPAARALGLAVLGFTGVVLLLNPSTDLDPIGVLAALGATALVAQSSLWMGNWPVRDALGLTAWQLFLGGVMLVPVAWLLAGPPQPVAPSALPGFVWLTGLGTAFAYWAFVRSLNRIGAQRMSMLMLLNPVTSVLLGVVLVQESLGWAQWLGIGLILLALMLMKRRPPEPAPARVSTPATPAIGRATG